MNIDLLRKVQQHILSEPARMNMDLWLEEDIDSIECLVEEADHARVPECGTIGCIAGWAIALGGSEGDRQRFYGFYDYGQSLLDLTNQQAARLFSTTKWPDELNPDEQGLLPGTPEYAALVSRAIDAFIADGTLGSITEDEDSDE